MLNAIAQAQLAGFLSMLSANEKATIPLNTLKKFIGEQGVARIKADRDRYIESNKQSGSTIALSEAGKAYWRRFKMLRAQADRQSQISQAPHIELKFSRLSERLHDDFWNSVPESEWRKFIIHDGTEETADKWDDRWDFLEGRPPLLREDLDRGYQITSPMNFAQRDFLSDFLMPEPTEEEKAEAAARFKKTLERIKKHREAE